MNSVVIQINSVFRGDGCWKTEIIESHIFDADTLAKARAKARRFLSKTFCKCMVKLTLDNYEYWTCVDGCDIEHFGEYRREFNDFLRSINHG